MTSSIPLKLAILLFFFIKQIFCPSYEELQAYEDIYGASVVVGNQTYPNYYERHMLHFMNLVRIHCHQYVDLKYARWTNVRTVVCDDTSLFWPISPVWMLIELVVAARYHSNDMDTNCKNLQHNSCDGTSAGVRVNSFLNPGCSYSGEIAWGPIPWYNAIDGWMCELCCAPRHGELGGCYVGGHTRAIFNEEYTLCGVGEQRYIVGDFSRCELYNQNGVTSSPIPSGVWHDHDMEGYTRFLAIFYSENYYNVKGTLVLNGVRYLLENDLGENNKGNWFVDISDVTRDCSEQYYFEFAGWDTETGEYGTHKFPKQGSLFVGEECTVDYEPSQIDGGRFPWLNPLEEIIMFYSVLGGSILLVSIAFFMTTTLILLCICKKGTSSNIHSSTKSVDYEVEEQSKKKKKKKVKVPKLKPPPRRGPPPQQRGPPPQRGQQQKRGFFGKRPPPRMY